MDKVKQNEKKRPLSSTPETPHSFLPTGTLTFLFTDIVGSTPFWEQHPNEMAAALKVHNAVLRRSIETNGGVVFKVVGDAFQASFPTATQALKAAIEGQGLLLAASWNELGPLKVRMGLHTGEAEVDPGGDEYAVSHTKNRAGRIMAAAHGGQILLSQEAKDLVERGLPEGTTLRDLGEHHLKGMQQFEHLYQVVTPDLPADFPPLATSIQHLNNLPVELTSFIGRRAEIAQLASEILLGSHRLVTLTGSGGTGKTRLALRVGSEVLGAFPDGVWLVELAPLADPDLVAPTIAQVLGLRDVSGVPIETVLTGYLRSKRLLLILDNCEHLLAECSRLADLLLKKCLGVTLLATSREILGVPGETPFRVPSLAVPDPKHPLALEEITSFDAVRLFLDRAEQAAPGFTLDSANANAVATVCRRLDGIPLAIELAAARTRVMAPQQIADRLDNVFRLLTGGSRSVLPRQQTLKATIDWSYALLSEPERLALQRLSVFAGSWTLEAAEVVVGGEDLEAFEVLDLQTGLVDKSLCSYAGSYRGPVRYRMLETVRQYAHDRLLEAGAGEKVRDCHLEYYLNLAEQAEPNLRGKGMLDWLDRLEEEYDNLRQALEWSLAGHIEEGMRLASSLWWFWHIRPYLEEGVGWLEQVLAVEAERRGTQPLGVGVQSAGYLRAYCRVVVALNELSYIQSGALSLNQRKAMLDESILLCRAVGRDASRELAYALLARGAFMPLEFERSKQYLDESLSLCRQNGYLFIESECLLYLGIQDQDSGEILQAKAHFELSLSISRQIEDFDGVGTRLTGLGSIASILGDRSKALSLFKEGLGYSLPIGNFGFYYLMKVVFLHYQYDQESVSQAEAALLYFRENQALPALVYCLVIFIEVEWSEGNDARADRFGQEAEAILTTQTPLSLIDIYINYYLWRGRLALTRGNRALARQHFKTLLPWVKDDFGVLPVLLSQILDTLAVWFAAEGQMAQSVRLFAAVDEIYRRFELGLVVRQRSEHDSALAAARVALGEEAFARSWQAGQALILWQAIEEVRQAEGWEDNHA